MKPYCYISSWNTTRVCSGRVLRWCSVQYELHCPVWCQSLVCWHSVTSQQTLWSAACGYIWPGVDHRHRLCSLTSSLGLDVFSLGVNTNAEIWYSADGSGVKQLWWWKRLFLSLWFIHTQSKPFRTYLIKHYKICMMFLHDMVSGIMSTFFTKICLNPISFL